MAYGSPVFAGLNQMEELLTKRKDEARQAMIDSLNKQNVESEMAAREDNAATNRIYRQGMADNYKAQELDRLTKSMSPHQDLTDPQAAELEGLPGGSLMVDTKDVLPQENKRNTIDGDAPAQSQAVIGHQKSFHGTPTQLEAERQRTGLAWINAHQEEFSKYPRMQQILLLQSLGVKDPEQLIPQNDTEPGMIFNQDTGQLEPQVVGGVPHMVKKGTAPINRSRTPKESSGGNDGWTFKPDVDPSTGITRGVWRVNPKENKVEKMPISGIEPDSAPPNLGGKSMAPSQQLFTDLGVPPGLYKNLEARRSNPAEQSREGEKTDLLAIIHSSVNASDNAKRAAEAVVNDPAKYSKRSIEDLVKAAASVDPNTQKRVPLSPEDARALRALLQIIRNDIN